MKKTFNLLICIIFVFCFASCSEQVKEKAEVISCEHNWVTKVSGGSVTVVEGEVVDSTDCTVLTYCTKCGENITEFKAPCDKLSYSDEGVVSIGSWSEGPIYFPATAEVDGTAVGITTVGKFFKPSGNYEKIKQVFFNESITSIGNTSFNKCVRLESITIPSNAVIGDSTFSNCTGLNSVTFLGKVDLGENAFSACYALKNVVALDGTDVVKENTAAFAECYLLIDGTEE